MQNYFSRTNNSNTNSKNSKQDQTMNLPHLSSPTGKRGVVAGRSVGHPEATKVKPDPFLIIIMKRTE